MVLTSQPQIVTPEVTMADVRSEVTRQTDTNFVRNIIVNAPLRISHTNHSDSSSTKTIQLDASLNNLSDVELRNPPNNSFLNYNKDTNTWSFKKFMSDRRLGNMCEEGPSFLTCGVSLGTHYDIFYGPSLANNGFTAAFANGNPDSPFLKHFNPIELEVTSNSHRTVLRNFDGYFKLGYTYIFGDGVCVCQDFNGSQPLDQFSFANSTLTLDLPTQDEYAATKYLSYLYVKTSDGSGPSTRYGVFFEPYQLNEPLIPSIITKLPHTNSFHCFVDNLPNGDPGKFDIKFSHLPNLNPVNPTTTPFTCYNLYGEHTGANYALLRVNNSERIPNYEMTRRGTSFTVNQLVRFERAGQVVEGVVTSLTANPYTSLGISYGGISTFSVVSSDYNVTPGTCYISVDTVYGGASAHLVVNQVVNPAKKFDSTLSLSDMPTRYQAGKYLTSTANGYALSTVDTRIDDHLFINSYNHKYGNVQTFTVTASDMTVHNPNHNAVITENRFSYSINSVETPMLEVLPGQTYQFVMHDISEGFDNNPGSSLLAFYEFDSFGTPNVYKHFAVPKTETTSGSRQYTLTVDETTPEILYYGISYTTATAPRTSFHMGNKIYVKGSTEHLISQNGSGGTYNLYVGTCQVVTNGVKTFVIDHPFAPKEKHLVHAALEGPEAGVYYRGKGKITYNGMVKVSLPYYFHALVNPETVSIQLQRIGKNQSPLSCEYTDNNHFYVYGDDGEFYWHVYASRRHTEFDVEPKKDTTKVRGFGPYTYID